MASGKQDGDAALLAILQSHGQQFLADFGDTSFIQGPSKKRKLDLKADFESDRDDGSGTEDEWAGFGDGEGISDTEEGEEIDDDDFTSEVAVKQPETIVFGEPRSGNPSGRMTKVQVKAFMSSKVMKLRNDDHTSNSSGLLATDGEDYEGERSNVENDALLHKLIHTKLLSSRSTDANLKPAERRRAIQGRVLELAAGAKLGSGDAAVRLDEHKRAAKKIRLGLERRASEKGAQALEEAKNLGNYHDSIKHLFNAPAKGQLDRRKRDKGLKMGVGHFSGGVLKLSKKDFASEAGHANSRTRRTKGKR